MIIIEKKTRAVKTRDKSDRTHRLRIKRKHFSRTSIRNGLFMSHRSGEAAIKRSKFFSPQEKYLRWIFIARSNSFDSVPVACPWCETKIDSRWTNIRKIDSPGKGIAWLEAIEGCRYLEYLSSYSTLESSRHCYQWTNGPPPRLPPFHGPRFRKSLTNLFFSIVATFVDLEYLSNSAFRLREMFTGLRVTSACFAIVWIRRKYSPSNCERSILTLETVHFPSGRHC